MLKKNSGNRWHTLGMAMLVCIFPSLVYGQQIDKTLITTASFEQAPAYLPPSIEIEPQSGVVTNIHFSGNMVFSGPSQSVLDYFDALIQITETFGSKALLLIMGTDFQAANFKATLRTRPFSPMVVSYLAQQKTDFAHIKNSDGINHITMSNQFYLYHWNVDGVSFCLLNVGGKSESLPFSENNLMQKFILQLHKQYNIVVVCLESKPLSDSSLLQAVYHSFIDAGADVVVSAHAKPLPLDVYKSRIILPGTGRIQSGSKFSFHSIRLAPNGVVLESRSRVYAAQSNGFHQAPKADLIHLKEQTTTHAVTVTSRIKKNQLIQKIQYPKRKNPDQLTVKSSDRVEKLYKQLDRVRTSAPLVIRDIQFLTEPAAGRGIYNKHRGPIRTDQVYVYAAIGNHNLEKSEAGYELFLVTDLAILDENGELLVEDKEFGRSHFFARAPHRETFINIAITMTGIPNGNYKLRLQVHDQIGNKQATQTIPFVVAR